MKKLLKQNLSLSKRPKGENEETVYPPMKYLMAYGVGLATSFFPLTLYAPVDDLFPAALAVSGVVLILTSLYTGRGIYPHQPLATVPHYVLNGALFSGIFGVVLILVAGLNAIFA